MKDKIYFLPCTFLPFGRNFLHIFWYFIQFFLLNLHLFLELGDFSLHIINTFFYYSFVWIFRTLFRQTYNLRIQFVLFLMNFFYHFSNFQCFGCVLIFVYTLIELWWRWVFRDPGEHVWFIKKGRDWLEFLDSPVRSILVFHRWSYFIEIYHAPPYFFLVFRGRNKIIVAYKFFIELLLDNFCCGIIGSIVINNWLQVWLLKTEDLQVVGMGPILAQKFLENREGKFYKIELIDVKLLVVLI